MSSPLNLGLVGAAFATIGGMVYGGYELLKNENKPIKGLLELKKRVRLEKTGDADNAAWLQSGQQYIVAHTKTEAVNPPEGGPALSPDAPKTKPANVEVIAEKDIGDLKDGKTEKLKKDVVPQSFKDKCDDKFKEEQPGIGTTEYKNFEKYCTKPDPEEA